MSLFAIASAASLVESYASVHRGSFRGAGGGGASSNSHRKKRDGVNRYVKYEQVKNTTKEQNNVFDWISKHRKIFCNNTIKTHVASNNTSVFIRNAIKMSRDTQCTRKV